MHHSITSFILISLLVLLGANATAQEESKNAKWAIGPFLGQSVHAKPNIESQARSTSVLDALGSFGTREIAQTSFGVQLEHSVTEGSKFVFGLGTAFQNFGFGYEKELKGERGVNSNSDNGINKSFSSWIIPFEWSKRIKEIGAFSIWADLGVNISLFKNESPWLFWKNSEYLGFSSENMSYFAFLETPSSVVINPRIGLALSHELPNNNSLRFKLNYLVGSQKSMTGQFTFLSVRPFEAYPDRVNYSTDYQTYFGTDQAAYDNQYDISYNGNQLQISLSYMFSFGNL